MRNFIVMFFCLIFIFKSGICDAQNQDIPLLKHIDSLKQAVAITQEDDQKVDLYHRIMVFYLRVSTEEGLKIIPPALELSEKLNYKTAETKLWAGRIYWRLGNTEMALKFHLDALKIFEEKKDDTREILTAIGQDYADAGNFEKGLEYFKRVKDVNLQLNDKAGLAGSYNLISWVYSVLGNYPESSRCNLESLKLYEELKDDYGYMVAASNLASDFMRLEKYDEAIAYLLKSCDILVKNNDYRNLSINYRDLSDAYFKIKDFPQALKYAELSYNTAKQINDKASMGESEKHIASLYMLQKEFVKAIPYLKSSVTSLRSVNANHLVMESYSQLTICYLRTQQPKLAKNALDSAEYFTHIIDSRFFVKDYLFARQLYDSTRGNWKDAYLYFYQYIGIRDSIYNADNTKKVMQNQLQYEYDKKEAAAKAAQEIKDSFALKELQRQKLMRNGFILGFMVVFIFAGVFFLQRNRISKEKKRTDEMLLNILPKEVAEELKVKGSADAKQFDQATVMFTDFKEFTQLSEKLSPTELVNEIHTCFKAFDHIIEKYNIEKIKTIGDSYMCAGGLPVANKTNAEDVVRAALEIQQFMQQHLDERKNSGKEIFEMRIGIHTGPVVAGIVGVKKFAYDIWGDTVNLASRMESSGEAGKVNISGATYELVKDKFTCTYRGKISAKNKGEIDMYFVGAGS